jgi:hypothetical protein
MSIVKKDISGNKVRCLINSSNILETVYDSTEKQLLVTFNSGRVYEYKNIDPKLYSGFEISESQGKYFTQFFKNLPSKRLGDRDANILITELKDIK